MWGHPVYTLLCLEWTTSKDLLYNTGNSAQIGEKIKKKKRIVIKSHQSYKMGKTMPGNIG